MNAALDRAVDHEVVNDDIPGLSDAVHAAAALLDAHGVPRHVVVDHDVGELQVQALAASIGRYEHVRLGAELLGDGVALVDAHAAVED